MAFDYTPLASTATKMITDFGQSVTQHKVLALVVRQRIVRT
jgi:hypothetical protein